MPTIMGIDELFSHFSCFEVIDRTNYHHSSHNRPKILNISWVLLLTLRLLEVLNVLAVSGPCCLFVIVVLYETMY